MNGLDFSSSGVAGGGGGVAPGLCGAEGSASDGASGDGAELLRQKGPGVQRPSVVFPVLPVGGQVVQAKSSHCLRHCGM